jgi:hypothetical protein
LDTSVFSRGGQFSPDQPVSIQPYTTESGDGQQKSPDFSGLFVKWWGGVHTTDFITILIIEHFVVHFFADTSKTTSKDSTLTLFPLRGFTKKSGSSDFQMRLLP